MTIYLRWARASRWQLIAGLLYAIFVLPSGWQSPGTINCRAIDSVFTDIGCWYDERVQLPLNAWLRAVGQGWVAELLIFPPALISVLCFMLVHPALSLALVPLYTVTVSRIVGSMTTGLWNGIQRLRPFPRAMAWGLLLVVVALLARGARAETRFVAPPSATLELHTTIVGAARVPVITLVVLTEEYCNLVDPLQIKSETTNRELVIEIHGYRVRESGTLGCSSDSNNALAKIPVDTNWLKAATEPMLRVRLGASENRYAISLRGYEVGVTPRQISNVPTAPWDHCFRPQTSVGGPIFTALYPLDVAQLVANGPPEALYPLLINVARQEGLTLADHVYPGLRQQQRCGLLVVVKGTIPAFKILRGQVTARYVGLRKISSDTDLSNLRF